MKVIITDKLMELYESSPELNIDNLHVPIPVIRQNIIDMSIEAVDYGHLHNWFIDSVGAEEPVWTEAHIDELLEGFIVIPKIST